MRNKSVQNAACSGSSSLCSEDRIMETRRPRGFGVQPTKDLFLKSLLNPCLQTILIINLSSSWPGEDSWWKLGDSSPLSCLEPDLTQVKKHIFKTYSEQCHEPSQKVSFPCLSSDAEYKGKFGHPENSHIGRTPGEDKGRDGKMLLQAGMPKIASRPASGRREAKLDSPSQPSEEPTLPTPGFWASNLQNRDNTFLSSGQP